MLKDFNEQNEQVVRQDRLDTSTLNLKLKIKNETYSVINCSAFGIAVSSSHGLEKITGTQEAQLLIDDFVSLPILIKKPDLNQLQTKYPR